MFSFVFEQYFNCMYIFVCAQRFDLDTMWGYIYVACSANNSLHQLYRNITCRHLSYWYRCVWFSYKWHWRFGWWRFWLCHGLWWFYILKTKPEDKKKEITIKSIIVVLYVYRIKLIRCLKLETNKKTHWKINWLLNSRIGGAILVSRWTIGAKQFFLMKCIP